MADGDCGSLLSSLLLMILIVVCCTQSNTYRRPSLPLFPREGGITCAVWNQTGCQLGECCIKEVITFRDLDKNILVGTRCKPLLTVGELCLRQPEGYLCDCGMGLYCGFVKNETYGHCSLR